MADYPSSCADKNNIVVIQLLKSFKKKNSAKGHGHCHIIFFLCAFFSPQTP